MSLNKILTNPALKDAKSIEMDEEFNNFMKRVGDISNLVKDMTSGDKKKAAAAQALADQYLDGKVIFDEDVKLKVKDNRTSINHKAFKNLGNKDAVSRKSNIKVYTIG